MSENSVEYKKRHKILPILIIIVGVVLTTVFLLNVINYYRAEEAARGIEEYKAANISPTSPSPTPSPTLTFEEAAPVEESRQAKAIRGIAAQSDSWALKEDSSSHLLITATACWDARGLEAGGQTEIHKALLDTVGLEAGVAFLEEIAEGQSYLEEGGYAILGGIEGDGDILCIAVGTDRTKETEWHQ